MMECPRVEELGGGLFKINVRLPNNPLRTLNSYVVCGPGRSLLIDTGFNQPLCLQDLREGVAQLGLDMAKTDIFITHFHADHTGLASQIASPTSTIWMGAVDGAIFDRMMSRPEAYWEFYTSWFEKEGYSKREIEEAVNANQARLFVSKDHFSYRPVKDGDIIAAGGRQLRCIETPGHTPGHLCLFDEGDGVLFTGDHMLFDITPNITPWRELPDALGGYRASLEKIRGLQVKRCLPAHRGESPYLAARTSQLLRHHDERLQEVEAIVRANPGISGYRVAGSMEWQVRAKSWEDFPPTQKWFALGEALSHLERLVRQGRVERQESHGTHGYHPL